MDKPETLEDFYKRKFDWMPGKIREEIGHFNVFRLDPFVGDKAKPVPYKRRDFYKIMLAIGSSKVHFADRVIEVKKQALSFSKQEINASQRISTLFLELLERQFPIEENHPQVQLRSASEFAQQLNIHVNHLNRAVKEAIGKTTSQLIAERILQEAKILLKHSSWNVAEIAYALGFSEATHRANAFNFFDLEECQTSIEIMIFLTFRPRRGRTEAEMCDLVEVERGLYHFFSINLRPL